MSECRCLTGGLPVNGTCLVCYQAAPDPVVGIDVGDGTPVRQSEVDAGIAVEVDWSDDVVPAIRRVA